MSPNISQKQQFESKQKIVNNAIKICVECGSIVVLINENYIFCK